MISLRDRILLLRAVDGVRGIDDDGLLMLAEQSTVRAYGAGDVIREGGALPRILALVVSGQVSVTSRTLPAAVLTARASFGVLEAIAEVGADRVVADVDTTLLEIPVSLFRAVLAESFSLVRSTLRSIGTELAVLQRGLPVFPEQTTSPRPGIYFDRPRTIVERLIELRQGSFAGIDIEALGDVTRRMKEVRLPAGHVFWTTGEEPAFALHVDYGLVRCTTLASESVEVGCSAVLGIVDLCSARPRTYEARAQSAIIAQTIDREDFFLVAEMHMSLSLGMLRDLARQLLAVGTGEAVHGRG